MATAIVGGLLGALHGALNIPAYMADPVVGRTVDSTTPNRRPDFLQSSLIPDLVWQLLQPMTNR